MVNLNRRHFLAAGLGAMAVTSLAACQQSGTPSGPGTPSGGAAGLLPSVDLDKGEAAEGGTLRMAVSEMPSIWNSEHTDGALGDLTRMRRPMGYLAYLKADEKGVISLNPDYVVEAKVKTEQPLVVSVKLNDKAVWEDGSPIVIADLAAAAKALSGANKEYKIASSTGWEDIQEIVPTDDQFTGEIRFKKFVADWMQYVFPSVPARIYDSITEFNTGYVDKATPSCGPFKIKSIDKASGTIILDRNPKWWGKAPKLETLIFRVTTQENLPSAFANSELDLIQVANGDIYDRAASRSDAVIKTSAGVTWTHLTLNCERVKDEKVRRAINYAINRDVIGQAIVAPMKAPVVMVDNLIFVPGQEGYESSWDVKYDRAKAEQILKDAGYVKDGSGVLAKDGATLAFSITVPAGSTSNINRALQIQKDLNAIGFKIELSTVPSDDYFKHNINPRKFDMATFGWIGTLFPISAGVNLFIRKGDGSFTDQNSLAWASDESDKLAKDANAILDVKERRKLINEFSKKVLASGAITPFYAAPEIWALKKGLVNIGAVQFPEFLDWTTIGFKK